jgi:PPK2 family polyphosphate:nucleotide phosphotransferase
VNRKDIRKLLDRYRITDGKGFRLKDFAPGDLDECAAGPDEAKALLADGVGRLAELQTRLYAQDSWAMLAAFQAMDAAGKDGTIRHVMTGVNPQGVVVTSFKQPGPEDLAHDFLWRVHKAVPQRGHIGIFNRSHYEEVLICRVHPALLDAQKLPDTGQGKKFWKHRYAAIVDFEKYLSQQGLVILKFFLHVSKDEQRRRFLSRIDEPAKNWKFSMADLQERSFWESYQDAYEAAIAATARPHAPWFVVPADHKWFSHLVVVEAMVQALEALDLKEPSPSPEECARLKDARGALEAE